MDNQEKKAGDLNGSFPLLNQLITSLEEAEQKFEEACKIENMTQINQSRELMLNLQAQIAKEIK